MLGGGVEVRDKIQNLDKKDVILFDGREIYWNNMLHYNI